MSRLDAEVYLRRPLLVVEDHLYHITRLLKLIGEADPELTRELAVVCLDRPGPDTERAVSAWLGAHPGLTVAAPTEVEAGPGGGRRMPLGPEALASCQALCRVLAGLLRPGGLLLQDIQLETLSFLPADRFWESIFLAATVRGMYPDRPPLCRFLSNKRGFEATFGRDLVEAGFDPRDVIEKDGVARAVVPMLRSHLDRRFPWRLEVAGGQALRVAGEERETVEAGLDLMIWLGQDGALEVGGPLLAGEQPHRVAFRPGSQEAGTWRDLVEDHLLGGPGLAVVALGERLAPEGAGRAEVTNVAARHAHGLRARLADPSALATAHHAYRLREGLRVGRAARVGTP